MLFPFTRWVRPTDNAPDLGVRRSAIGYGNGTLVHTLLQIFQGKNALVTRFNLLIHYPEWLKLKPESSHKPMTVQVDPGRSKLGVSDHQRSGTARTVQFSSVLGKSKKYCMCWSHVIMVLSHGFLRGLFSKS